ncbi:hypothetical protein TNCV_1071751 [Trichonephila clavipes]|nr:hypothetical protein TNCV_1071751 [Trichonephila clavipes]
MRQTYVNKKYFKPFSRVKVWRLSKPHNSTETTLTMNSSDHVKSVVPAISNEYNASQIISFCREYQKQIDTQGISCVPQNHIKCVPTIFGSRKSIDSGRSRTSNLRRCL